LKTDSESLPTTDVGSKFQTDGAAHRRTFPKVGASERLDEQRCSRRV